MQICGWLESLMIPFHLVSLALLLGPEKEKKEGIPSLLLQWTNDCCSDRQGLPINEIVKEYIIMIQYERISFQ